MVRRHRAQIWTIIERLGKGEVTCKEAEDALRQEKMALSARQQAVLDSKRIPALKHDPHTWSPP